MRDYRRCQADQIEDVAPVEGNLIHLRLVNDLAERSLSGLKQGRLTRDLYDLADRSDLHTDVDADTLFYLNVNGLAFDVLETGLLGLNRILTRVQVHEGVETVTSRGDALLCAGCYAGQRDLRVGHCGTRSVRHNTRYRTEGGLRPDRRAQHHGANTQTKPNSKRKYGPDRRLNHQSSPPKIAS